VRLGTVVPSATRAASALPDQPEAHHSWQRGCTRAADRGAL